MWLARSAESLGSKLGCFGLCVVVCHAVGGGLARADSGPKKSDQVATGYEIFNREWMPNDPRGHGGDGLGPVYNDSSCVACHNSGGSGGAGPISKNIDILSAALNAGGVTIAAPAPPVPSQGQPQTQAVQQAPAVPAPAAASIDTLLEVHAGFRTSRTAVLHKFGTDPNYDSWRSRALTPAGMPKIHLAGSEFVTQVNAPPLLNIDASEPRMVTGAGAADPADNRAAEQIQQIRAALLAGNPAMGRPPLAVGAFTVSVSQRNPTPLFGLGLIDAIPSEAIEAIAKRQAKKSPEIQGRVSRLKDGRIGRLGWKAQTANVEDFVLNACAVELGLEVPGHHQAMSPQAPKYQTTGLDLNTGECAALVAYVRSLPKPVERKPSGTLEAKHLGAGKALFSSIGCAGCHSPSVADVEGIYSDLLLHDMGAEMADEGSYSDGSDDGGDDPLGPLLQPVAANNNQPQPVGTQKLRGATKREWKTPPLWGFRDSGPYLHDGRAQTLEQAVALHGGQGAAAAQRFFKLSPRERLQVEAFLKSLVAPQPQTVQLAQRGE
jgi:CxxC motif-containing protein (DUF1111 family)